MSPKQLSGRLKKGAKPDTGYLFLGAEPFYRGRCYEFLRENLLGRDFDETAVAAVDLRDFSLTDYVDEIHSPSLFAGERLVVARNAEQLLPTLNSRGAKRERKRLAAYFKDPLPDTVALIEATRLRWDDRDGKRKLERLGRFFDPIPVRVDFKPLSEADALYVGQVLMRRLGVKMSGAVLSEMVEMLGADANRLEGELEKLALYSGGDREITSEDIGKLVPEARQRGMFELSDAIADRDRARALEVLDTMSAAGMYWGMQVGTLANLFRHALAAKDLGATRAARIQSALNKFGIRMWRARALQIERVVSRYGQDELREALIALFEVDRGLRSPRPDDRILMEQLVLKLTKS